MDETTKVIQDFYNNQVVFEWSRIDNRPEFLLTCRMLDRYIKPDDSVLDIGGGPGRYTLYYANKGNDVTLFDLSPENIQFALKKAAEDSVSITAIAGDAREVSSHISEQFDHVLLMGPMYHLLEEHDRITAVNEAIKLLKLGGMLYVSFINLFAGIIYGMKYEPDQIASTEAAHIDYLEKVISQETFTGDAFTKAVFIDHSKILPFMAQFPLEKLHLFGQEGITSPNELLIRAASPEIYELWLDYCEKLWEREDLLNFSEHIMYVGRKI